MPTIGICSLCLERRQLSFEHVPPKRAFNNYPAVAHTLFGLNLGDRGKKPPPLLNGPGGLGRKSLCISCNGSTATWYGDAYADWTTQCLRYAPRVQDASELVLPFTIQPLNILKQIITMSVAVANHKVSWPQIDALRHFVLSRQAMSLPQHVIVRAYFNPIDPARKNPQLTQNRLSESCAVLDTRSGTSVFVFAEIAFPPMGYVVYFTNSNDIVSEDFESLCDIRRFSLYPYSRKTSLFLNMPTRHPFGPVPGYYPNLRASNQRQYLDDNHVVLMNRESKTLPK
jgi:hypothetical protein